jgi:hypothetical protein
MKWSLVDFNVLNVHPHPQCILKVVAIWNFENT